MAVAVDGAERLAKLTSCVAKGTYSGFDTSRTKIPVEIDAGAPNQLTTIVHFFDGTSIRTYNGRNR